MKYGIKWACLKWGSLYKSLYYYQTICVYFHVKVKVSVLFWIRNGIAHCDKGCEYHQVKSKSKWGFYFLPVAIFKGEKKNIPSQKKGKEEVVGSSVIFYVTLIFLLPEHIISSIRTN